jgi:ESCRT-II complex subunit VPS22
MKALSYQTAIDTIELLERKLTEFAGTHADLIRTDPVFRSRFLAMCAPLGVDPLQRSSVSSTASSKGGVGGLWQSLFGTDLSDYYHELAVKIAEVCFANKSRNGGIMSVSELQQLLIKRTKRLGNFSGTGNTQPTASSDASKSLKKEKAVKPVISAADIEVAIGKLAKLGGGFRTIKVGDSTMVISVPTEFDSDHTEVLTVAKQNVLLQTSSQADMGGEQSMGITVEQVMTNTGWTRERVTRAIDLLLQQGMAWVDDYRGEKYYWFPSIWQENR